MEKVKGRPSHCNRQYISSSLGADIDTLLIAPRHIERSDFFSSFHDLLLSEKGITNVRAVPDAFVPVIKIEYEGIEVCLCCLCWRMTSMTSMVPVVDGFAVFSTGIGCHSPQSQFAGCEPA